MKKILVIHGPNINLLGLQSVNNKTRLTLDKINQCLKKEVKNKNITFKIIQSDNESKINTFLHRNYKKSSSLLYCPGIWNYCGFIIKNTIDIIDIPYVIINFKKYEKSILKNNILYNNNPQKAYIQGLHQLFEIL